MIKRAAPPATLSSALLAKLKQQIYQAKKQLLLYLIFHLSIPYGQRILLPVPDLFSDDTLSLPPQKLTSAIEISSHLRALMTSRTPLELRFTDSTQLYQSYIVDVDREHNRIAFDELIPNNGHLQLINGAEFEITTHRDGVRMTWSHHQRALPDILEGSHCYWLSMPTQLIYYQRRNAFRAATLPEQLLEVQIDSKIIENPIRGRLLDISATGCKVEIKVPCNSLQPGQLYETFAISLPAGNIILSAELRHLYSIEATNTLQAGFKFHAFTGANQRTIERFVYQLQREARRSDDALF